MIFSAFPVFTGLLAIASASPYHQILRRAGGPIANPIPTNCTIQTPGSHLNNNATHSSSNTTSPYRPTNATLAAAPAGPLLYGYFLPMHEFPETTSNSSMLFQQCLSTCYGFGTPGTCRSVYQAYNYPAPPRFGSPGGDLTVACLMFGRALRAADFEAVPVVQQVNWTMPRSGNIVCPAGGSAQPSTTAIVRRL